MRPALIRGGHAVHFWREGDDLCGRATIYTRFGPQHITARVNLDVIRAGVRALLQSHWGQEVKALAGDLIQAGADDDEVAGFFDDVGNFFEGAAKGIEKGVRTIGKSKVFQEIAGGLAGVMHNPVLGPLITAIPYVGPALQVTATGAGLIASAYAGDPKAKQRIKRIHKRAQQGDPKAKRALANLKKIRAEAFRAAAAKPIPNQAIHFFQHGQPVRAPRAKGPEGVTREDLLEALGALAQQTDDEDAFEALDLSELGGEPARRIAPSRYDAMVDAYKRSGYRVGASGLPIALESGADGYYQLPQMKSYRGIVSTYGLRVL